MYRLYLKKCKYIYIERRFRTIQRHNRVQSLRLCLLSISAIWVVPLSFWAKNRGCSSYIKERLSNRGWIIIVVIYPESLIREFWYRNRAVEVDDDDVVVKIPLLDESQDEVMDISLQESTIAEYNRVVLYQNDLNRWFIIS